MLYLPAYWSSNLQHILRTPLFLSWFIASLFGWLKKKKSHCLPKPKLIFKELVFVLLSEFFFFFFLTFNIFFFCQPGRLVGSLSCVCCCSSQCWGTDDQPLALTFASRCESESPVNPTCPSGRQYLPETCMECKQVAAEVPGHLPIHKIEFL